MGEDRQDTDQSQPVTRLTVSEAAAVLGISVEAVRGRIKRGTIEHEREGARVYVLVGGNQSATGRDQGGDQSSNQERLVGDQAPLVENLLDQVAYLREQLAEEREARRRADTIIAQLSQANAALAARVPQLEAPDASREPQNEPESAEPRSDRGSVPQEPEKATERPWWRRLIGG